MEHYGVIVVEYMEAKTLIYIAYGVYGRLFYFFILNVKKRYLYIREKNIKVLLNAAESMMFVPPVSVTGLP